jgi:hypothetical protein
VRDAPWKCFSTTLPTRCASNLASVGQMCQQSITLATQTCESMSARQLEAGQQHVLTHHRSDTSAGVRSANRLTTLIGLTSTCPVQHSRTLSTGQSRTAAQRHIVQAGCVAAVVAAPSLSLPLTMLAGMLPCPATAVQLSACTQADAKDSRAGTCGHQHPRHPPGTTGLRFTKAYDSSVLANTCSHARKAFCWHLVCRLVDPSQHASNDTRQLPLFHGWSKGQKHTAVMRGL